MKNVLSLIASVAIVALVFSSCKKEDVSKPVTPPIVAPADVTVTMISSEVTTSAGKPTISITFEIAASNKDAYLPKKFSPYDLASEDAGGIAIILKVQGYETTFVMTNVGVNIDPLISIEGGEDKTSSFLIRAGKKATMVIKVAITDKKGVTGKAKLEATWLQTFSNPALTEGNIKKELKNVVSNEIIL